jgi:20S proteasome alpha/beta subunit
LLINIYTNFSYFFTERGVLVDYLESVDKAKYKSGTTIVGLLGKDFVVLGSDKQGTLGNFAYDLMHKNYIN